MSATARGKRGGEGRDFFPTPTWCVRRLLEAWTPRKGLWLEPCAGQGHIIKAVPDAQWEACEISDQTMPQLLSVCPKAIQGDFLRSELPKRWAKAEAVITNPPFALADAFLHRILTLCPGADVALLLRLAFVEGSARSSFMRLCTPDVYVLPERPSFTGDGKTDMAAYSWFIWPADRVTGTPGKLQILNPTPLTERRAG